MIRLGTLIFFGIWSLSYLSAADQTWQTLAPLSKAKKSSDRASGPTQQVELALWVPDQVPVIRGVLVNPFYLKAVEQKHTQDACRTWGFAVLGANYFGVQDADFGPSLLEGLKDLAEQAQRPELEHVPFLFIGISAGAGMSCRLADQLPDRTLAVGAVCLEVGPRSEASRPIPILTVFGEKDGQQMRLLSDKLPLERQQQAHWAIAPQWRQGHEFYRANNLVMPWFDAVIRARYPAGETPLKGPVKLKPIPTEQHWLGDPRNWQTVSAAEKYPLDKAAACWLPDAAVALTWRAFVSRSSSLKIVTPLGQGDKSAPYAALPAQVPVTVTLQGRKQQLPATLELFTGATSLGNIPLATKTEQGDQFRIDYQVPALKQGIHPLWAQATFADGTVEYSPPNTVIVLAK